jgi:GntR family transcriptional regulator
MEGPTVPGARVPRYLEIKADLLERIQRGEFTAGQALPSQASLSRQYGVTLMTLRQALASLEKDEIIVQLRGRGTFVAPGPAVLDLRSLNGLAADMREQGVELVTEVLAEGSRALTRTAALALAREPGERGLRLERLRRIGGRPVVHQVSWVPAPWAEALRGVEFGQSSLYASLRQRCALLLTRADEEFQAGPMPRNAARAAGVPAGRPAMVTQRTTFDSTGTPVVYDRAVILGDALRVLARRTQHDIRLSWAAIP